MAILANEVHVLIVDDEPDLLSLAESVLVCRGFQVTPRASGTEALQLLTAKETRCDLLLTDFDMPRVNGLQLAQMARQARPALPVLIMSGNPTPTLKEEVTRMQLSFVAKPWRLDALLQAVQSALKPPSA